MCFIACGGSESDGWATEEAWDLDWDDREEPDEPVTEEPTTEATTEPPPRTEPLPYTVGEVKIISDGSEYEPLTNWVYGLSYRISGSVTTGGMQLRPEHLSSEILMASMTNVSGELPVIRISEDFAIEITYGEYISASRYILYNSEYEILHDSDVFEIPGDLPSNNENYKNYENYENDGSENDGGYILCIELTWSNKDTVKFREYSGYQYFFKLIKEGVNQ
jgi:hypothetical protein